jgi:hypothetical protein
MTAGLVAAFLGYLLVWAAVKGVHPWAPIVEAFGGTPPPSPGSSGTRRPHGGPGGGPGPGAGPGGLTMRAARCKLAIDRTYPGLDYLGGPACRKIIPHDGGTSDTWSEHAWGNAIDYGGSAELMRKLIVWANLNKVRYQINNVIPPGAAVNVVHIDFLPSHAGQVPPCAGGS